ncbi:SUF system Fe-S cluster assembly regulator [Hahella sp. HN01]|uniref:SUF system Fe-S cluster assembly regulator n=1 Tax=Hahella sp. HN01 TaxID=2847262 RepID=UPI001C1F12AA|nr:SUF system Fe-S cluster assembly regulator [Hahella sp. HN01]MBU6953799.1 SUF system Fe-S cluster assembly regulator [Hahella sp. HN01]
MLRLARLADYGLLIASALDEPGKDLVKLDQVADQTKLPIPTVRKIMKLLVDGGVVHSERGVKGGYCLSDAAYNISIARILRAVEGGVALTDCCAEERVCDVMHACTVHSNWSVINQTVNEIFERLTLRDMSRRLSKADIISKVRTDDDVDLVMLSELAS